MPGTDVMILKIFSPKHLAKKIGGFVQNTASFRKNWIISFFFKQRIFSPQIFKKTPKIEAITSTPVT
jgi:hypothetical protein